MRVLLISPEYPDTYWSFRHALKFISKKAVNPPLGLLTIAAMLPPHWEKKLVDLNVNSLREKDIMEADYVLTGRIAALFGAQETSASAQAGVHFGLIGALATSGATTEGRIDIRLVDLRLRHRNGTEIPLEDIRIEYDGELPADAYCWAIYPNVNARVREAIAALSESVVDLA